MVAADVLLSSIIKVSADMVLVQILKDSTAFVDYYEDMCPCGYCLDYYPNDVIWKEYVTSVMG